MGKVRHKVRTRVLQGHVCSTGPTVEVTGSWGYWLCQEAARWAAAIALLSCDLWSFHRLSVGIKFRFLALQLVGLVRLNVRHAVLFAKGFNTLSDHWRFFGSGEANKNKMGAFPRKKKSITQKLRSKQSLESRFSFQPFAFTAGFLNNGITDRQPTGFSVVGAVLCTVVCSAAFLNTLNTGQNPPHIATAIKNVSEK